MQLAEKMEMSPNHVCRLEKDRMRPRQKAIERLAELFEVPVGRLLAPEQDVPPRLLREDPELAQLLAQVSELGEEQRGALRMILRSMLTCQQLEHLVSQGRARLSA